MSEHYDVIVAGLGSLGSAAAFHLARRGRRVLGLDRFTPPHAGGSHHGKSRIIREAYFEDPRYVPLVLRAYEDWAALERECGRELMKPTGGLMIGVPDGLLVAGAKRSAEEHGLPYESLSVDEVRRRHPAVRLDEGMDVLFEPRAAVLSPEACVQAHLDGARVAGARLRFDEPVTAWFSDGPGVRVETPAGRYYAERLVLSAGAWMGRLVRELENDLEVERQVLYFFEPVEPELCTPAKLPIFLIEHEYGRYYYGFPDLGEGAKVAIHHEGEIGDPDRLSREVEAHEVEAITDLTRRYLPAAAGTLKKACVCMYTNTPDRHFIVDFLPEQPAVLVASPCSGHGFKFCGVLGAAVAALVDGEPPLVDLSMFRLR
jgi:sarcosine oxidase